MHIIKDPDSTNEISVGDRLDYRGGVRRDELVEGCEVIQIEAFCVASNDLVKVDSIFEFTPDQDPMLAAIHVRDLNGVTRWGYWDQVSQP